MWFQNRRIKWRRQNLEREQARLAQLSQPGSPRPSCGSELPQPDRPSSPASPAELHSQNHAEHTAHTAHTEHTEHTKHTEHTAQRALTAHTEHTVRAAQTVSSVHRTGPAAEAQPRGNHRVVTAPTLLPVPGVLRPWFPGLVSPASFPGQCGSEYLQPGSKLLALNTARVEVAGPEYSPGRICGMSGAYSPAELP